MEANKHRTLFELVDVLCLPDGPCFLPHAMFRVQNRHISKQNCSCNYLFFILFSCIDFQTYVIFKYIKPIFSPIHFTSFVDRSVCLYDLLSANISAYLFLCFSEYLSVNLSVSLFCSLTRLSAQGIKSYPPVCLSVCLYRCLSV